MLRCLVLFFLDLVDVGDYKSFVFDCTLADSGSDDILLSLLSRSSSFFNLSFDLYQFLDVAYFFILLDIFDQFEGLFFFSSEFPFSVRVQTAPLYSSVGTTLVCLEMILGDGGGLYSDLAWESLVLLLREFVITELFLDLDFPSKSFFRCRRSLPLISYCADGRFFYRMLIFLGIQMVSSKMFSFVS